LDLPAYFNTGICRIKSLMLTDDEIEALAREHVKAEYLQGCEILEAVKMSIPDGIYFVANVRTDDWTRTHIGDGGVFY
jgi:hypothetical protein